MGLLQYTPKFGADNTVNESHSALRSIVLGHLSSVKKTLHLRDPRRHITGTTGISIQRVVDLRSFYFDRALTRTSRAVGAFYLVAELRNANQRTTRNDTPTLLIIDCRISVKRLESSNQTPLTIRSNLGFFEPMAVLHPLSGIDTGIPRAIGPRVAGLGGDALADKGGRKKCAGHSTVGW